MLEKAPGTVRGEGWEYGAVTRAAVVPLLAFILAASCGRDESNVDRGVPSDVVAAVQEEHPRTRAEDIANFYGRVTSEVPGASDEDVSRWLLEALEYAQLDEWSACLDQDSDGTACDEIDGDRMSPDNPIRR